MTQGLPLGGHSRRRGHLDGEGSIRVGEGAVDRGEDVELLLDGLLVLLVQEDLQGLGAVSLDAGALAGDLGGVDDILEDGLVDGGKSAGTRTDLDTLTTEVLVENGAVSDHKDVLLLELLLEFTDHLRDESLGSGVNTVGEEDDDGGLVGLATGALDLLRAS